MNDGLFVPARPDGMGVFEWENGNVLIIRNHENGNGSLQDGPFGGNNQLLHSIPSSKLYDSGKMNSPCNGGTTTLIYNELTQSVETQYLSLGGTMRNCSGGITPWNSWLSCEEDVSKANSTFEKDHGYLFEVPASSKIQLVDPVPLVEMGRFNREAVAVDPSTGIVYQTEDRGDGLIYRFIPNQMGNLGLGGKLQALAIVNRPSFDTRNWEDEKLKMNELLSVKWIDMENVLSPEDDLRYRGYDLGAARFARGEGIWYGNQEIYFAATNGGKNKFGQVFRYKPSPYEGTELESMQPGYLELFAESADKTVLHMCDNLTIAPWGDVILCEDNGELNHIRGIKRNGEIYDLACNRSSNSEFAGVVFSPSGATLFVNLQDNGDTVAITGPWETFI
jgi:secreted PhoX family phosphatase